MNHVIYKSIVYLNHEINGLVPTLVTDPTENKQMVLDYVKNLFDNEIIQAYRICYSCNNGISWYMDSEVVYLKEGKRVMNLE